MAARSGTNPSELARQLRADRALWVDRCGELFYQDAGPAVLQTQAVEPWGSPIATSEAFRLHSRPGSQRVLFLDFDGHTITGTGFNSMYGSASWDAPAFSIDNDPATFSAAERQVIIEVWQRVAQDYAPFDVNVTTQDPGPESINRASTADTRYGSRALITPDTFSQGQCGCAGRAYIDVFDAANNGSRQPAWVYSHRLWNNAKYLAEAVSHEVGHNLGLRHDGKDSSAYFSGSGGWGPIMGNPYGQSVTQWSKGDYAGATNTENDVAKISANGAALLADDVPASGTPVSLPTSLTGMIHTAADTDSYWVTTGAGLLDVSATPGQPGPNLDLALTVADADGQVLATAGPAFSTTDFTATMAAELSLEVPAGTYQIVVDGTGNGLSGTVGASDYGSIGWYELTVDGAAPPTPTPTPTPTPDPTPTPTPTPTEGATPLQVSVAKSKYGDRLLVDVDPDQGTGHYSFQVQSKNPDASWATLPTRYDTAGSDETSKVTLGAGRFRAVVEGKYGHVEATSAAITLTERTVSVRVRPLAERTKLRVNVDPDKGSGYWTFQVRKRRADGSWRTLPAIHRTWGPAERRTLNLSAGRYRVLVAGKYGFLGAESATVRLVD